MGVRGAVGAVAAVAASALGALMAATLRQGLAVCTAVTALAGAVEPPVVPPGPAPGDPSPAPEFPMRQVTAGRICKKHTIARAQTPCAATNCADNDRLRSVVTVRIQRVRVLRTAKLPDQGRLL